MHDDPTIQHGAQPLAAIPFQPERIRGAVVWPGNDISGQWRITLALRQEALREIGHAADCCCDAACRPHRERIVQLQGRLGLPQDRLPTRKHGDR